MADYETDSDMPGSRRAVGPYLLGRWADTVVHAHPCDCDLDEEDVGERCIDASEWTYAVFTAGGAFAPRRVATLPKCPADEGDELGDIGGPECSAGVGLLSRERRRQVEGEHFSADHDARHTNGELAAAAWCYLSEYLAENFGIYPAEIHGRSLDRLVAWPWSGQDYKPSSAEPLKQLAKIGALVAAEIDRLLLTTRPVNLVVRLDESADICTAQELPPWCYDALTSHAAVHQAPASATVRQAATGDSTLAREA